MLYTLTLSLHNLNRWLILLIGFAAILWLLRGWWGQQPWQPLHTRLARAFADLTGLQFVLGLVLYLLPGTYLRGLWQNLEWAQMMQDRLLRFFVLEHPLQMFIAIGVAHIALSTARRLKNERRRYAWTTSLLIVALLLILAAIPWPGFYYARPLFRLPF